MKPKRDDANRSRFFRASGIDPESVVSVSQIHSRIVRVADSAPPFASCPEGDGVITGNRELVPCVTVADCMPIFVFDPESGCFGALSVSPTTSVCKGIFRAHLRCLSAMVYSGRISGVCLQGCFQGASQVFAIDGNGHRPCKRLGHSQPFLT